MRHANIPIFIPHMGCPHDCIFCDQKQITGRDSVDLEGVRREIETALATVEPGTQVEIAFFGGSFTGIDRDDMIGLLELASRYVKAGMADSIRLSTRPDYINAEILGILARYPVRHIELGIQSLDDRVLMCAERGHDAACALSACHAVVQAGFCLTGQMMIGLPRSSMESEIATAEGICRGGAQSARVYPTVVLRGTELEHMVQRGEYLPPDTDDMVRRTAVVLEVFDRHGVEVIRIGLCATERLCQTDSVCVGSYHSAFGELARSEVFYRRICQGLDGIDPARLQGASLKIVCPKGCVSQVIGQKRRNITRLLLSYGMKNVKTVESDALFGYNVEYELSGEGECQ